MRQHPELVFWKKCPICGYTIFDSESHSKRPKVTKMLTFRMMAGHEPVPAQGELLEAYHPIVSNKE